MSAVTARILKHNNQVRAHVLRIYAGTSTESSRCLTTTSAGTTSERYVSPFASFFQNIENKRTTLGTPDDAQWESNPSKKYLKCGISEDVLSFKTVSYGRSYTTPHVQPGEHQITLQVNLKHLPLNEDEQRIFQRIVGRRRIHDEKVRLISNFFASRIENKRHVVSMLDRLVLASQLLAKGKDGEEVVRELKNLLAENEEKDVA